MSDTDAGKTDATAFDRRRELLRRRMIESGLTTSKSTSAPMRRVSAGEHSPLASGQRRMWFVQTRDPADTTLNIGVAYRLTGALDEARLRAAVASVFARHAILRTTYGADDDGEPYQVFRDDVEIPWQYHDLSDLPEDSRARRVEVLARREFGRPFDLTTELPLRITLARGAAEEFVLILVVHHICWDDDAWAVFFTELNAAYTGTDQAPAPTAQFVDVEVVDGPAEPAESDLDYWRTVLRPVPEPLELPGPTVVAPSKQADRCALGLSGDLFDRVERFAREHAATPFMVLLAGFGAVVQRYTAASDFLVSVPVTDRRTAAAARLIGYFGNTLLIRQTVRPGDTFATLVESTREMCAGAFAHQGVGIDRVVRELRPDRTAGRDGAERLVRLGFSVRKDVDGLALPGMAVRRLDFAAPTAQIPLALTVVQDASEPYVEAEYWVDELTRPVIEHLLAHFVQLLDSGLARPHDRISELDMLGETDRAAILELSRGASVDSPPSTLVALLQERVAATPEACALLSDTAELTYEQLNRRANRLAHWLIRSGIGAEDIVGLRLRTSIEFIVAVLGVLKAGAAYLPIDPAYPDDRIDYLIEDACPGLVLGAVELDAAETAAAQLPESDPTDDDRVRPLAPGHLAYVIYTSGSTGKPKGVAVSHAAIAEHVSTFAAEWGLTADERCLQSASVSFDASLGDIFVTLASGACLVVPKPDAFRDVRYVADLIARHRVTALQMVPSMLSTFLLLPEVRDWRSLRRVPVGGEALPGEVADRFAKIFDAELRNHYGPTEAVVCSTHTVVSGPQGTGIVPIGVPNRNVHAYVLNEALQVVPNGVVGEIYLGGAQLARGYLGRPALTAQRFVADPFTPGARLYRTGDLARRNESGELDFIGRADEQVKVRGFRIELGEVESVIAAHPQVAQCVVVVAEDAVAGPMLAAYVVAAGGDGAAAEVDLDQVRTHAATSLPEHMVPSAFAVIDRIPVTVNGKLDKRALPLPTPTAERSYREPETPTERRLCAIFAQLFAVERVGADDSFFELGGHSLLAARLVARIRAEFGVELEVRAAFETPTPAGLAAGLVAKFRDEFDIDLDLMGLDDVSDDTELDDAAPVVGSGVRRAVRSQSRPERIPLSYAQVPMWFQYRMEGASPIGNLPFAVRLDGPLDLAALTAAVGDVVGRHEALRTTFPEHDGIPYQLVHPNMAVPVRVTETTADQLTQRLAEAADHRFELDGEPLLRVELFVLDAETHVLSVVAHHIVVDHASLGVFLTELTAAYRARIETGRAPEAAPPAIQYIDYSLWQREVFDPDQTGRPASDYGKALVEHWRTALSGLPDQIAVAHDRARPPVLGKRGEVVVRTVSPTTRDALETLAKSCGASEFMLYQTVVATLLHKIGGGVDIALGTPITGRVDRSVENLIGLFANMVVLRNNLSGNPTLRELVTRGRDVVLDAYGHQELPIERLVEVLNPARSRSWHPLYQNMIHFRGADWVPEPVDLTSSGATTVTALPVDFDVAFMDLNLSLNVRADGGMDVRLVANSDLYEPETAGLIADALVAALDGFATEPDRPVAGLEVLPEPQLARLLARPASGPADARTTTAAAGSATEQTLIALLEELLDISGVCADDGFFALGGDSVISIQWSARATAAGLPLTPQLVFEHPTIAELAAALDTVADQQEPEPKVDDSSGDRRHAPMSASGLDDAALAALAASWQARS
ncbi:amino acid adenylation domain-containing protein [Nocardia sp. NPDC051787]|uniref:amino acid adenylation domain-containing protein n=1 Tax=Nocardia sp. NPDC051787 TaxID=3155415 RepID=UPI00343CFE59